MLWQTQWTIRANPRPIRGGLRDPHHTGRRSDGRPDAGVANAAAARGRARRWPAAGRGLRRLRLRLRTVCLSALPVRYPAIPGHEPVGQLRRSARTRRGRWDVVVGDRVGSRSTRPLRHLPRMSGRHASPLHRAARRHRLVRFSRPGPAARPLGRLRGLPLPRAALGGPQDRRVDPAGDRYALQPDRRGLPLGRRDAEPPARRDDRRPRSRPARTRLGNRGAGGWRWLHHRHWASAATPRSSPSPVSSALTWR